jgi:hypothetical protein
VVEMVSAACWACDGWLPASTSFGDLRTYFAVPSTWPAGCFLVTAQRLPDAPMPVADRTGVGGNHGNQAAAIGHDSRPSKPKGQPMTPPLLRPVPKRFWTPDWEFQRTIGEMRNAIGAALFERPCDLDIRLLWTRGGTGYFRVNWWTASSDRELRIRRSTFIRVERDPDGYQVRCDDPLAA